MRVVLRHRPAFAREVGERRIGVGRAFPVGGVRQAADHAGGVGPVGPVGLVRVGELGQFLVHFVERGPGLRAVSEHAGEEGKHDGRDAGQVGVDRRIGDGALRVTSRLALVRVVSRHRVGQRRAERVDIGRGGHVPRRYRLLRGHAGRRAEHVVGEREVTRPAGQGREAEVDHPGTVLAEDDVARLEVPVQHARLVNRDKRLGQGDAERRGEIRGKGAVLGHVLGERETSDVLAREPRQRRAGRRGRDEVGHPGALHHLHRLDLPLEAAPEGRPFEPEVTDRLHRDLVAVLRDAVKDRSHPALPQPAAQRDATKFGGIGRLEGVHAHLPLL